MKTGHWLFRSLLVLGFSITISDLAFAADPEVEARFKRGVELYNEADFRTAAVEFRRAYEKGKNYKILYNLAQAEFQVANYVAALGAFELYLKEGGTQIPQARREEVEQEIPRIRSRVASVTVKTNVQGANISVDDHPIGPAPLAEPVLVNPGTHRVTARMEGWNDSSKLIDVAGGDTPNVDLTLDQRPKVVETPIAPAPAPAAAPAPAPASRSWTPPVVAWATAGVFTGGAILFGLLAQSKSNELKDEKNQPNAPASRLSDLDSSTGTLALITDIAIVGAVLSAGVATWLTIDRANSPATGRLRVAPTLGGLACSGTF
jgi:hypothetical protein